MSRLIPQGQLFSANIVRPWELDRLLRERHYLGPTRRGFAWLDEFGALVLASPSSRHLPHATWLELSRWCLSGKHNGGSMQWAAVRRWLLRNRPEITTVVSYSDPEAGHTGALYRACNWRWAPTWQLLVPSPSGHGSWDGIKAQGPKDRWVDPLRPDPSRLATLGIEESYARRFPWAQWVEPVFKRGRPVGGGASWKTHQAHRGRRGPRSSGGGG